MAVEFQLTRAEYFAAQSLHSRRRFRRFLWVWLLLFLSASNWLQRDRFGDPGAYWVLAVLIGVGLLLLAVLDWAMPRILATIMVLTAWRQQPMLREPVSFEVDDAGLRYHSDRGNWQYRWADLIGRAENSRICLLYLAPNLMLPLPRRVLTETDLATIRRHLGR
ncbi:YcxB family protein [Paracoccus lutimaris]|uniref:YcxB-like protein n=1 Tax=Paracoccus lutimaris TaxID=1490030 RepID=A0A368YHE8_9RHOB|nr:YcxB family protein [Paracoccus lutimaris]RCW79653.1 YcxB-like protein [Paracoccus lutimaris]